MTHICIGNLTITGSHNDLSPSRRQAIIWTNAGILLIRPLGTNFSEISIEILRVSLKKMLLKMSSVKWYPLCLGLNITVNSWWHKYGSTLAQVMACCLTAPSHYLNQCRLIISKVQWHPSESNFTRDTSVISHWNYLENYLFKILFKSSRGQ